MSRFRRVWVVYRKELIDTLRDRRTLIAMVLVPIVLYPLLMIVLVQALRTESGRRQAERYRLCVPDAAHRQWLIGVFEREQNEQEALRRAAERLAREGHQDEGGLDSGWRPSLRGDQLDIVIAQPGQSLWDRITRQQEHAGILLDPPPNPDEPGDATNRIVQIIYRDTDPRSEFVHSQLNRVLSNETDRIVRERLKDTPGGEATLTPLLAGSLSTATPAQQFAKILAMIVPFLLVIMTVTGAMYPAIDLTAGERERGTLETLAVAPVPVGQIVAGKFCVILTIAMISTTLNLGSMSGMVHFSKLDKMVTSIRPSRAADDAAIEQMILRREAATQAANSEPAGSAARSQRDNVERRRQLESRAQEKVGLFTRSAPIVLLAMVPFAVLAAAVMLAACSFARTFKEAQNYMMPVMMAAIIPAMVVSYMPTIKLEGLILVMPVANIVALIRELLLGNTHGPALAVCLLSTCVYAAAAVAVAARLYGNEAVLFSDVGSYKTLLRRSSFRPQERPWPALALLTVAVLFPLYFYWQSYLADPHVSPARFRWIIALAQLLLFAAPPILVAWYCKCDLVQTFSLRLPRPLALVASLLIAASIVPVGSLATQVIAKLVPSLAANEDTLGRQMELLTEGPLLPILLTFAILPGICEELLFRGFLLAGLRDRLRPAAAVIVVGVIFGIFHIYVEKIPVVSLLGMLLAAICLRSGSIFPAMLVHMANNGLALASTKIAWLQGLLGLPDSSADTIHFNARTAVFCGIFAVGLVVLMMTRRSRDLAIPGSRSSLTGMS